MHLNLTAWGQALRRILFLGRTWHEGCGTRELTEIYWSALLEFREAISSSQDIR